MQGRVHSAPALQQVAVEGPAPGEFLAAIKLHRAVLAGFRHQPDLVLPAKDEGVGEMIGPLKSHRCRPRRSIIGQHRVGDVAAATLLVEILEEEMGLPILFDQEGIGVIAAGGGRKRPEACHRIHAIGSSAHAGAWRGTTIRHGDTASGSETSAPPGAASGRQPRISWAWGAACRPSPSHSRRTAFPGAAGARRGVPGRQRRHSICRG